MRQMCMIGGEGDIIGIGPLTSLGMEAWSVLGKGGETGSVAARGFRDGSVASASRALTRGRFSIVLRSPCHCCLESVRSPSWISRALREEGEEEEKEDARRATRTPKRASAEPSEKNMMLKQHLLFVLYGICGTVIKGKR
ncbi:hypothetical protein SRHO_G00206290 [Serrasalmus rhombeus]